MEKKDPLEYDEANLAFRNFTLGFGYSSSSLFFFCATFLSVLLNGTFTKHLKPTPGGERLLIYVMCHDLSTLIAHDFKSSIDTHCNYFWIFIEFIFVLLSIISAGKPGV